jgi:hypothetical protein
MTEGICVYYIMYSSEVPVYEQKQVLSIYICVINDAVHTVCATDDSDIKITWTF